MFCGCDCEAIVTTLYVLQQMIQQLLRDTTLFLFLFFANKKPDRYYQIKMEI